MKKIPELILLLPNRVWRTYPGGRVLDEMEGKPTPLDSHFPEDWIASTTQAVNDGRKEIVEGFSYAEIEGKEIRLKTLFEDYPLELLGEEHYRKFGANTQFLLKFLDSAIRLHIQAHPTIPFAQKYLNSNSGKTEAYVILGIREEVKEPYIYLGFQNPLPRNQFKKAVVEQDTEAILSCFEKIPIQTGDLFVVPGGLPHAIGEGVFMIEIMEPTDFAVRLEFERGGYMLPESARFMNRGVDFAMEMINFEPKPVEQIKTDHFCVPEVVDEQRGGIEVNLFDENDTPCFSANKIEVFSEFTKRAASFYVGIITKGNGTVSTPTNNLSVEKGDRFFTPFQTEKVTFSADNNMEIICTYPPN